jgi:chemotaxis signal transduction protein
MMPSLTSAAFVLFPLGQKRYALPASRVSELARPDTLQTFPHTSKHVSGVLLRRGGILPVCDIAEVVAGKDVPPRKFYLIAVREIAGHRERTAIPVSGECELTNAELLSPTGKLPGYVRGLLSLKNEIVEVVDLEKLLAPEANA